MLSATKIFLAGLLVFSLALTTGAWKSSSPQYSKTCFIEPLGSGRDDTDQVEHAIQECGHHGTTVFGSGQFNITRKMTWDLVEAKVDMHGYLNFHPDVEYWLNANNTYRVVFIQNQASWFVVTGRDFIIDAHNQGGINGNGQVWWDYYANRTRADGDGRPISLTLGNVTRGIVKDFRVEAQPFWCNAVAHSDGVVYDGMFCNATNTNPAYFNTNLVPNTDGINTFRANDVKLYNFDISSGDDCLAIKGNSTHIHAKNIVCRGGNGIAFGSIGQYAQFNDIIDHVTMENIQLIRQNATIQPNLGAGIYFKTYDGTVNGIPPASGGGGGGYVSNVLARNVTFDPVNHPLHVYQTLGAKANDTASSIQFSNLTFEDWTGSALLTNIVVDIECSPIRPCPGMKFKNINIAPYNGSAVYVCDNTINLTGLPYCNTTDTANP